MTLKTFSRLLIMLLGGTIAIQASADVDKTGASVKWSYVGTTGPAHWGMLSKDFEVCDTGRSQSPINIERKRIPVPYSLSINYHTAPLLVGEDMDNTYTVAPSRTIVNTGYGVQVNFHEKKKKELLTFDGKEYELVQFHFHSPSETLWHKQAFPLEIHFVHQGKDSVLVLAVFVKGGTESSVLKTILENLPEKEKQEYAIQGSSVDPASLLPDNRRYYAFGGSLTTPPCTEGLQWIVMPEPITASPAQILKIRDASGGTNARPVQPLNGRTLYYAVPQS